MNPFPILMLLIRGKWGYKYLFSYCMLKTNDWRNGMWYCGPFDDMLQPSTDYVKWCGAIHEDKDEAREHMLFWYNNVLPKKEIKNEHSEKVILARKRSVLPKEKKQKSR